ncbi:MAG: division/cell wall cluster transcriptional repressor MraZ [Flavobacteriales bacterium]
MQDLIGEYQCRLDAKSRFMLPAGLRKQLDPECKDTFVMNRGYEGCLTLYPLPAWKKLSTHLSSLNMFIADHRKFYRQFHNGATQIQLDKAGRMLMPKNLMRFASIGKEIVLFAYADRIEVWAKDHYEKYMSETQDDFEALAEAVMGKGPDNEPKA